MSDAPARQRITRTRPSALGASHRRALQYSAHYRGCAPTHLHTEWNANRRAHSAVHRTSPTLNAELTELAARLPKSEQLIALFKKRSVGNVSVIMTLFRRLLPRGHPHAPLRPCVHTRMCLYGHASKPACASKAMRPRLISDPERQKESRLHVPQKPCAPNGL
ncbi:hypothetical protein M6B38_248895 [Iris pallida]|uniref:Uncharacterized protein n=1 Tax=Iris pallida TaxID=29817 RepID=A0AAX6DFK1_IRIPA|nr:hypothetical protein M6B38_248895 [Iris pallida]